MSTPRALLGQTNKVLFAMAFVDENGQATDPSGTPTLAVHLVNPDGTLTLKQTLNLAKLSGITGWWGASQDVSDDTTWPAGEYQLVSQPTISGVVTLFTDAWGIDPAPVSMNSGWLTDAYCSEDQVRSLSTVLENVSTVSPTLILNAAQRASREVDRQLRKRYTVPFAQPYDDGVVLITMWLAGAYALENTQGQRGNRNELGDALLARAEEALADIASGVCDLGVPTRTDDSGDGEGSVTSSSEDRYPRVSILPNDVDDTGDSPLEDYV